MRCAAILNNVVQNTIAVAYAHKAAVENATGMKLIEISEDMNVQTGDIYDPENQKFVRDGVDVSEDSTIVALRERVSQTEQQMANYESQWNAYEQAYAEGVQNA